MLGAVAGWLKLNATNRPSRLISSSVDEAGKGCTPSGEILTSRVVPLRRSRRNTSRELLSSFGTRSDARLEKTAKRPSALSLFCVTSLELLPVLEVEEDNGTETSRGASAPEVATTN